MQNFIWKILKLQWFQRKCNLPSGQQEKTKSKHNKMPTQNSIIQSIIFKNCENNHWRDVLQVNFLKHHKICKIFHKNTRNLSYSCCRNIGSVIASHHRIIIQPTPSNNRCNCINWAEISLDNKYLTVNTLYKAVVSASSKKKKYFAILKTAYKDRFRNHTRDFRHKSMLNPLEF